MSNRFTYDEPLKVSSCVQAVCDKKIKFGHGGKDSVSVLMVALLIAGCDKDGTTLYHTDPSGTYIEYKAKAVGVGQEGAQSELQENYNENLTLQQAENLALNTKQSWRKKSRMRMYNWHRSHQPMASRYTLLQMCKVS